MKMMSSSTEAWSVQLPARMKVNEEKNRSLSLPSSKGLTLVLFRECDCRLITKQALSPFVLTASHKINIIILSLLTEVLRLIKDRQITVIPQSTAVRIVHFWVTTVTLLLQFEYSGRSIKAKLLTYNCHLHVNYHCSKSKERAQFCGVLMDSM